MYFLGLQVYTVKIWNCVKAKFTKKKELCLKLEILDG